MAKNNKNRKPIVREETVVDPLFPIPPGVLEFTYAARDFPFDPDADRYYSDGEDVSIDEDDTPGGAEDEERSKPRTPRSFRVIKQNVRTRTDGSQVVDLTVEVETVPFADRYEFRITNNDTGRSTIVGD